MFNNSGTARNVEFGECLLTTYPLNPSPILVRTLILKSIVVSIISFTGISCNLVFIIAYQRTPSLHSISNRLLSYLSMSDFLMSAVAMPLYITRAVLARFSVVNCVVFNTERILILLLSPASFSLLFLISFERFLAVVFPLKYTRWCSGRRVRMWFAAALSFSVLFMPVLLWDIAMYYAIFGVVVCLIVVQILTIYAMLYRTARLQRAKLHPRSFGSHSLHSSRQKSQVVCLSIQKVDLDVPASSQQYRHVSESTQKYLHVPQNTHVYLQAPASIQKCLEVPESSQEYLQVPGSTQGNLEGLVASDMTSTTSKGMDVTRSNSAELKSPERNEMVERLPENKEVVLKSTEDLTRSAAKENVGFTSKHGTFDQSQDRCRKQEQEKEIPNSLPAVTRNGALAKERSSCKNLKSHTKDYKAEKTIAIILLVMILCYLPAIIFVVYVAATDAPVYSWHIYGAWFEVLVLMNCSCNPCIYYLRNPGIRRAVVKILSSWFRLHVVPKLP